MRLRDTAQSSHATSLKFDGNGEQIPREKTGLTRSKSKLIFSCVRKSDASGEPTQTDRAEGGRYTDERFEFARSLSAEVRRK